MENLPTGSHSLMKTLPIETSSARLDLYRIGKLSKRGADKSHKKDGKQE